MTKPFGVPRRSKHLEASTFRLSFEARQRALVTSAFVSTIVLPSLRTRWCYSCWVEPICHLFVCVCIFYVLMCLYVFVCVCVCVWDPSTLFFFVTSISTVFQHFCPSQLDLPVCTIVQRTCAEKATCACDLISIAHWSYWWKNTLRCRGSAWPCKGPNPQGEPIEYLCFLFPAFLFWMADDLLPRAAVLLWWIALRAKRIIKEASEGTSARQATSHETLCLCLFFGTKLCVCAYFLEFYCVPALPHAEMLMLKCILGCILDCFRLLLGCSTFWEAE